MKLLQVFFKTSVRWSWRWCEKACLTVLTLSALWACFDQSYTAKHPFFDTTLIRPLTGPPTTGPPDNWSPRTSLWKFPILVVHVYLASLFVANPILGGGGGVQIGLVN